VSGPRLSIEHLSRPAAGQVENGDAVLVKVEGARTLVVVMDALGHGPNAAATSRVATDHLEKARLPSTLDVLIEELHRTLRHTRGLAALFLLLEPAPPRNGGAADGSRHKLQSSGVGNIGLRSLGSRVQVLLKPGILGVKMDAPLVLEGEVREGDRIIVFSDGLSSLFDEEDTKGSGAAEACRTLMSRHARKDDDATVLVLDVLRRDGDEDETGGGQPTPRDRAGT
jgi:phosphoserine phosphatase RsbX